MSVSYFKTSLYTATATMLILCTNQVHAQQYYKWVDANGSTHYTTTAPPKGAKRLDKVATYATKNSQQPTPKPQDTAKEEHDASHHQAATTESSPTPAPSEASTTSER
ncbi:hypothetical protein F991_02851 [Acinetobacter sp. CIP-A165]|uniref:DUF4124 domain-containing protein n=1 Tax=Acinetobacter sp. CIP-A165 TaxID=40373 RepID=UPI0002CE34C4|nr:DUF4124 domain-containing protein [Acinetobacter sp. CIP-A165]ENU29289.1 hypothetical protein F991_02851 [Acinetobacter sp. CIP-A165]